MTTYSVVEAGEAPLGAAYQCSQVVIDRLGPANEEQRAERKAAVREWIRGALHRAGVATLIVICFGIAVCVGGVIGAYKHGPILELLP